MTDGPDSEIVLQNEMAIFSCVAEGRPPPNITWLQQSPNQMSTEEVVETEGVSIVSVQRGARQTVSNLTFQSVEPRDAAQYTCSATNIAGSDTQSANLTVHGMSPALNVLYPAVWNYGVISLQYYQ